MTHWDLLKRMRGTNWQDLAKELGVTPQTLKKWRTLSERNESCGKQASMLAHQLFHATLREYDCDWISITYLNWNAINTIGGRK